jgi:hypothetical protein
VRPDGRQFLRFPFTTTTTNSFEIACVPAGQHYLGGEVTLASSDVCTASATGLRLEATGGPVGEFGFFLVAPNVAGAVNVFNGVLCLNAPMARYNGQVAANQGLPALNSVGQFDAAGVLQNLVGTSTTGLGFDVPADLPYVPVGQTIQPGESWSFQLWYRDRVGDPPVPGSSANFSDALVVQFS